MLRRLQLLAMASQESSGFFQRIVAVKIVLTPFARARLFPKDGRKNAIQDATPESFERHLNEQAPLKVLDGYAPFCKLHVYRNWTGTRCLTVPIKIGGASCRERVWQYV